MSDSNEASPQVPLTFILSMTAAHFLLASAGLYWWMPQVRSVFTDLGVHPTSAVEFVLSGRFALVALGANGVVAVISIWRRSPLTAVFGISAVILLHLTVTIIVLTRPIVSLVETLATG